MRLFPRTQLPRAPLRRAQLRAGRRLAATCACVAGSVLLTSAVPALADDGDKKHLQQQQHAVQQRERSAQHDLDESSSGLRKASATLAVAEHKLAAAREKVLDTTAQLQHAQAAHAVVQKQLADQRARLAAARTQLASGQKAVDEQRAVMRDAILDQFSGGDPKLSEAAALLRGGTVEELMRQKAYTEAAGAGQDADLQRLEASETLLAVHRDQVRTATDQVAAKEQRARDLVGRMAGLRDQAQQAHLAVGRLVAQAGTAKQAAESVRAHDLAELKRLESQDDALRNRIVALSAGATNRTVGSVDGIFVSPVSSTYVTSPFGWRKHPIYGYWGLHNGVDLHAPCGTPLHAADAGRIISAVYSPVWGNRLFLYLGKINGHSYTAVYNHISRYRMRSGSVARGQVVAYAGTTGWSTACHLHFTILRDGNPVDPAALIHRAG